MCFISGPDYNKLNDKSSLDQYSTEASKKIIDLVEKMHKQFSKKLDQVHEENDRALAEYDELR